MYEKIIALFAKYRANTLSESEFQTLKKWVNEDEENKKVFAMFIRLYKIENRKSMYQDADPEHAFKIISGKYEKRRKHKRIRLYMAAACLVAFISTITVFIHQSVPAVNDLESLNTLRSEKTVVFTSSDGQRKDLKNGTELITPVVNQHSTVINTLKTPKGGHFKLILPDQSIVWINGSTTLQYAEDFLIDRTIVLHGEAFFEVIKNGTPFYVKAAHNKIKVLGTKFNVSAYQSRPVVTTLVRGSVEVSTSHNRMILLPQQQVISPSKDSDFEVKQVNTDIYSSWITGAFEFQNAPLHEIMEQLNQWFDIEIIYENPQLMAIHFTGTLFRDNSIKYSLDIIKEISNVKFRNEKGKLYVYK